MLLMNAASVLIFHNNAVSATVENRSGWFFPHQSERGPLWSSIKRSFFTSVTIVLAAILLGVISCFFAYFDTETTDKCFGIEPYLNDSLPVNVFNTKVIWRIISSSANKFFVSSHNCLIIWPRNVS